VGDRETFRRCLLLGTGAGSGGAVEKEENGFGWLFIVVCAGLCIATYAMRLRILRHDEGDVYCGLPHRLVH